MKKDNKIYKFIKDNYKIIIPILLILVLFIAFFIYYKVSILDNYKKDTEDNFYQYFYDKKYEYKGVVSTNRHDVIVDFKTDDYDITFDSTPIYYSNIDKVIFPKDMSVVMPTLNCAEYLAKGYSYLEVNKDNYILTTDNYSNKLGKYFLFDGGDLYFFLDEVTLKIGDSEIKISPMSYVVAKYNNSISYYDKKNDTYKTVDTKDDKSLVYNDYYKVYVSLDQIDYYGTNVILTASIDELNTIDKKGK